MIFTHTADWHVGANRNLLKDAALDRQMAALAEVYATAAQFSDGVVVVAGDVFDSKNVRERERNAVLRFIERQDKQGFRSLFINGNHDILATSHTSLHPLKILSRRLSNTWVAECNPLTVHVDGVPFVLFPPREKNQSQKAAFQEMGSYLEENDLDGAVVVTHFGVTGAKTETGYVVEGGWDVPAFKRVRYWALGDIHRCQCIGKAAFYPGNPLAHRWGENEDKGVLLVDTDDPENPRFVPVSAPHFLTMDRLPPERPGDAYVKLRAPAEEIPPSLPDWVIATEITTSKAQETVRRVVEQSREEQGLLDGLGEVLAERGVKDADMAWCLEKAARV